MASSCVQWMHAVLLLFVPLGPSTLTRAQSKGLEASGLESYDLTGVLEVGMPVVRVEVPIAGGRALFELQGLQKKHGYEVKLSFPGTVPATYRIELANHNLPAGHVGPMRRLLDTEKLMFTTDDAGRPLSGTLSMHPAVVVTVEPLGVVAGGRAPPVTAVFNIELEELRFGIPRRSWWVACLALLSLAAVVVTIRHVPQAWLMGGGGQQAPKTH